MMASKVKPKGKLKYSSQKLELASQDSEVEQGQTSNEAGTPGASTPLPYFNQPPDTNLPLHATNVIKEFNDANGRYVVIEQDLKNGMNLEVSSTNENQVLSQTSSTGPSTPTEPLYFNATNGESKSLPGDLRADVGNGSNSNSNFCIDSKHLSCVNETVTLRNKQQINPLLPVVVSSREVSSEPVTPRGSCALSPTPSITQLPCSSAALYRRDTGTLYLPIVTAQKEIPIHEMTKKSPSGASLKQGSRKKKRSGSWYNVLSPSYKQKNEDFHKFFKTLPETERLLVDYSCALVKDILIQGRLYVSQNFVCFHSKFLKLQTAIQISYKDITSLTKEKTVKVIPNAIQFQTILRGKLTFTSFTARDRAYQQILKLWQLRDQPMTPQDLWSNIRDQYGNSLGCSSDDDYVKPENKTLNFSIGGDSVDSSTNGSKRRHKKKNIQHPVPSNRDMLNQISPVNGSRLLLDSDRLASITDHSTGDEKSSLLGSIDETEDLFKDDDDSLPLENEYAAEDDDSEGIGPADYAIEPFKRTYLQQNFNVSAARMFDTIYGDNCPFWKNHLSKEANEITICKWGETDATKRVNRNRTLDYILSLSNPLGPKTSRVTETQVLYKESQEGWSYAVDCHAKMHGVPYSEYFITIMRYCIKRLTKTSCELRVSADIKFIKTPWGLVKNFIEKNCHSGIEENFSKLGPELEEYFEIEERRIPSPPCLSTLEAYPRLRKSLSIDQNKSSKCSASDMSEENKNSNGKMKNSCLIQDFPTLSNDIVKPKTLTRDHIVAAPTTTPLALPSYPDLNNNGALVHSSSKGVNSFRQKWRHGAILIINYSMYQRLNSLEQIHTPREERTQWNNLPKPANRVYGMPGESEGTHEHSKVLHLLERRLAHLEDLVNRHVTNTEEKWRHLTANWMSLEQKVENLLCKLDSPPDK